MIARPVATDQQSDIPALNLRQLADLANLRYANRAREFQVGETVNHYLAHHNPGVVEATDHRHNFSGTSKRWVVRFPDQRYPNGFAQTCAALDLVTEEQWLRVVEGGQS